MDSSDQYALVNHVIFLIIVEPPPQTLSRYEVLFKYCLQYHFVTRPNRIYNNRWFEETPVLIYFVFLALTTFGMNKHFCSDFSWLKVFLTKNAVHTIYQVWYLYNIQYDRRLSTKDDSEHATNVDVLKKKPSTVAKSMDKTMREVEIGIENSYIRFVFFFFFVI